MPHDIPMHTSWSDLDEPLVKPPDNAIHISAVFAALFGTPDGQEVLAWLRERTIEKPTLATGLPDGLNTVIYQNLREGENNLYRLICSQIKRGKAL